MAARSHEKAPLAHLARPGAVLEVRVHPGARRNALTEDDAGLRAEVTAPPEDGRANRAVGALLAEALGIAPSQLHLIRGGKARRKAFRIAG